MILLIIALMIGVMPRRKEEDMEFVPELATADGPDFTVPEEELPEINLQESSEVKKQIEKFIKEKPDAVANLLRNWFSDDYD
jgi:flagellar M-ring protein FliF